MWAGIAIVTFLVATAVRLPLAQDPGVARLCAPARPARAHARDRDGVGGSARWISVGPFTFQFSELAKILMIIVLADYLASREGRLDSLGSILGACLLVGPPLALVMLQPDLGTSLVFAAILAGMLWMSGASLRWLVVLAAAVVGDDPHRLDVHPA